MCTKPTAAVIEPHVNQARAKQWTHIVSYIHSIPLNWVLSFIDEQRSHVQSSIYKPLWRMQKMIEYTVYGSPRYSTQWRVKTTSQRIRQTLKGGIHALTTCPAVPSPILLPVWCFLMDMEGLAALTTRCSEKSPAATSTPDTLRDATGFLSSFESP